MTDELCHSRLGYILGALAVIFGNLGEVPAAFGKSSAAHSTAMPCTEG